jgi:hypothetical protein
MKHFHFEFNDQNDTLLGISTYTGLYVTSEDGIDVYPLESDIEDSTQVTVIKIGFIFCKLLILI